MNSPQTTASAAAPRLPEFFEADRAIIETELDRLLPAESVPPASIHAAMRYSVFAGGKRLRPILCLEAARVFAAADAARLSAAAQAGCALEFIHTYSLIHDDLPALDNDDLRRGKPTCHKQFGEANAILAGDALLTLAFQRLAEIPLPGGAGAELVRCVACAAGTVDGMVGGQVADLEAAAQPASAELLEYIHRSKTAALFRASLACGAICGGASPADVAAMDAFGGKIGLAFQVVDDLLDIEESSAALGKTAGKDVAQNKLTYPALFGVEKSREVAAGLLDEARALLEPYGERGARLRELAEFLVRRRS